jgi:predicted phage replisome organizer
VSEIKWIKIVVDIFDDEKIKLIESMPEGDSVLVIWFKLLCKAGKLNSNGEVYLQQGIPYTDEMLATVFNRPLNIVRLALQTFVKFQLVEITDQETLFIANWEKHQNVDGMELVKIQNRDRKRKQREKLKLLMSRDSHDTVTHGHAVDIDIDKDIDKDKEYTTTMEKFENLLLGGGYLNFEPIESRKKSIKRLFDDLKNQYDYDVISQAGLIFKNSDKKNYNHQKFIISTCSNIVLKAKNMTNPIKKEEKDGWTLMG